MVYTECLFFLTFPKNFGSKILAHISAKSPSNITPNPSDVGGPGVPNFFSCEATQETAHVRSLVRASQLYWQSKRPYIYIISSSFLSKVQGGISLAQELIYKTSSLQSALFLGTSSIFLGEVTIKAKELKRTQSYKSEQPKRSCKNSHNLQK